MNNEYYGGARSGSALRVITNSRRQRRLSVLAAGSDAECLRAGANQEAITNYQFISSEDRMSQLDSATTYLQRGTSTGSWLSRLSLLLVMLAVAASSGLAQVTLTHVGPGIPPVVSPNICSGLAPQFTVSVGAKPTITYNVAANNGQGMQAQAVPGNVYDITAVMDEDMVYEVPVGNIQRVIGAGDFEVTYFGTTYNLSTEPFFIGSNGFVRFSDRINNTVEVDNVGIVAQNIPAAAQPNNAIYFLNRDLAPRMGVDGEVIWYEVQNIAGEDVLVVSFEDVSQYNILLAYPFAQVNVQVLIWADGGPNAGRVQVRLVDFPAPGNADPHTIGVENACGVGAGAATAAAQDVDGAGPFLNFVHNNVTHAAALAQGQAGVGVDIGWDFTAVAGANMNYRARLVTTGTNLVADGTSITAVTGDEVFQTGVPTAFPAGSGTTGGAPFALNASSTINLGTAAGQRTYYAYIEYANCTFERSAPLTLTVVPQPTAQTISGPTTMCTDVAATHSVASTVTGSTFGSWTVTGGAFTGSIVVSTNVTANDQATITVPSADISPSASQTRTISVTETSPAGCSVVSSKVVTVFLKPAGVIGGGTSFICAPTTGTATTPSFNWVGSALSGPTYAWSLLGAGASGATVTSPSASTTTVGLPSTFTQAVSITPINATLQLVITNGSVTPPCATTVTTPISFSPIPTAKTITGPNPVCQNTPAAETYTLTLQGGTANTFAWSATGVANVFVAPDNLYVAGTPVLNKNSLTLNWTGFGTGTVTAIETTPDGCSRTHTLTVTVNAQPTPSIVGSNTPCAFVNATVGNPSYQSAPNPIEYTYLVSPISAGSTWSWSVTNGTIQGANNSSIITVRWTAAGAGNVTLTETNANGCSNTVVLNTTVVATPPAGNFLTNGPLTVCAGTNHNYTITGADGAAGLHTFTVVGGTIVYPATTPYVGSATVASGNGNGTLNITWGAGASGTISHEYTVAGCAALEVYTVTINQLPTATIGGSSPVCGGQAGVVYTATAVNAPLPATITNYNWTTTTPALVTYVGPTNGAGVTSATINFTNSWPTTTDNANVTLTLTNSNGCINTISRTIVVHHTPDATAITAQAGPSPVCGSATGSVLTNNYTFTGVAGAGYNVTLVGAPAGSSVTTLPTSGAGAKSATVTWGNYEAPNNLAPVSTPVTVRFNAFNLLNGSCVGPNEDVAVTLFQRPAVPTINVPPLCTTMPLPVNVNVTNNGNAGQPGVTYAWSATGGMTFNNLVPSGITNQITALGGAGFKNITVTATGPGGCTRQSVTQVEVVAVPAQVVAGPTTACVYVQDPAGMNGSAILADVPNTAYVYTYSDPTPHAGWSYSWTVTNGQLVAWGPSNVGPWTAFDPTQVNSGGPILNATHVRIAWWGPTPGVVKFTAIHPGGCSATTPDYVVGLSPIPVLQSLAPLAQNICSGNGATINQAASQAGFTYTLQRRLVGTLPWSNVAGVATQAGGAPLTWNIPAAALSYTTTPVVPTQYEFRVVANSAGCGLINATVAVAQVDVYPTPNDVPVVNAPNPQIVCTPDNLVFNVQNSQTWVRYTLERTPLLDFAGNPVAISWAPVLGGAAVGNGATLVLTDNTNPAGSNPLLNANNYRYRVIAEIDPLLLTPVSCSIVLTQQPEVRVFALPLPQVVAYTNPVCWEQPVQVNMTGSQDGVTYEVLRNGLSMAPPVIVQGTGAAVNVAVPALSAMPTNPLVPTVVTFSVRGTLRTGAAPYNRPVPASLCPNTFGASGVTINPKPVAVVNGPAVTCGPSTVNYTPGPSWGMHNATYDWELMAYPTGSTPVTATNSGFGTVNPYTVNWGTVNLSCNGSYNPFAAQVRLIETNVFGCADTALLNVTIQPTIADATIIDPADAAVISKACIYGGFESHLRTYTIQRPNPCVFPAGTTWLWTMPIAPAPVTGVIRSGQGTPSIVAEWNTTGGTNIGTVTCVVTLPLSHGGCATTYTKQVIVYPLPVPVINGPVQVCQNQQNVTYTADNYPTDTYNWQVIGGTIVGGSGNGVVGDTAARSGLALNTIQINWLDVPNPNAFIRLTQVSAVGCMNVTNFFVTVNPTPTPTVSGPDAVCNNRQYTFTTANNAPANTYSWTVVGAATPVSGANSASFTVQTAAGAGAFTVSVTETVSATNCSKTATKVVGVVIAPNPVITRTAPLPGAVGGACVNQTVTYQVANIVGGRSYRWTVVGGNILGPNNAPGINVQWNTVGNGSITVEEWVTATQCTTSVSQPVQIVSEPNPTITGSTNVCGQSSQTYSTPLVAGNTYAWSMTPGPNSFTSGVTNNSVSILFGNPVPGAAPVTTLTVVETNTLSGCSKSASLNITVRYQPQVQVITRISPAGLAGQACNNDVITYGVAPSNLPHVTYNWTVTGGTLLSPNGSNTVAVQWTTIGAQTLTLVETTVGQTCSATSTLNVAVSYKPTPSISGSTVTCTGTEVTYSTPNVAGSTYSWALPAGGGMFTSPTTSNTVTVMWTAPGPRSVAVQETNGLCQGTASINVNVGLTPTATAISRVGGGILNQACENQTIGYSTPFSGTSTYLWTVTGGNFVGGINNASTVNVQWTGIGQQTLAVRETTTGTNCFMDASINVDVTRQPTPSIVGATTVCTEDDVTYSTASVPGSTYTWSLPLAGGTFLTATNTNSVMVRWTAPGARSVSVTETAGNCSATTTVNVTVGFRPVATSISRVGGGILNQSCENQTIGYSTPFSGTSTYLWTVTGGNFVGGINNTAGVNVQWTGVGQQTLRVRETTTGTNCFREASINVDVTRQPTPSVVGATTVCTLDEVTYSTASVPGSTYAWSLPLGGGTFLTATNTNSVMVRWTTAGARSISVTETAGNCTATSTVNVTVGQKPTTTTVTRVTPAGQVGQACNGQSITYSTPNNAGNTYEWTVTGGVITNGQGTSSITVQWATVGNQTVTIKETTVGTQCSTIVVQNVSVTAMPEPVIAGNTISCINKIHTYTTPAVPGHTYSWSITPANVFAPIAGWNTNNSITVQWTQPGLHRIIVTETSLGGYCVARDTMFVQVNLVPNPLIVSTTGFGTPTQQRPGLVCELSTHTYSVAAPGVGNVFEWTVVGGAITSGQFTSTITVTWSNAQMGSIAVRETVPGSDCTTLKVDEIDIRRRPTPVITGNVNPCANSEQFYETPFVVGNEWLWTVNLPAGSTWNVVAGQPNRIRVVWANVASATAATITVREFVTGTLLAPPDPTACATTTAPFNITVRPLPPVITITGPTPVCATDETDTPQTINTFTYTSTNPADGTTAQWTISSNGQLIGSTNGFSVSARWVNTSTVQTTGTITVTHTSPFGCVRVQTYPVTINPLPNPIVTGPTSVCQGSQHNYSTVGFPGHTYQWVVSAGNLLTGATTPNATVTWTQIGNQTIEVRETNTFGCLVINRVTVRVNELPNARLTVSGPTTFCQGGDVTLSAPLGFANYLWSTGETSRNIVARTTGNYWVTVTDANGCSANSDTVTVNVFPSTLPIVTFNSPLAFCEGDSVTLTAPAGFTAYLWSTGETTQTIVAKRNGTYTVTVADNNGCTGTSTDIDVTVYPAPQPILTVVGSTSLCADDSVEVRAPNGFVSYSWTSSSGTAYGNGRSIIVRSTDTVSVTVVDGNGCTGTSGDVIITLTPIVSPVVTVTGPTTFCEGNSVVLTAPAGFAGYIWSNGATGREITVTAGGTYSVTVTNASLCTANSAPVNVTVNPLPARPEIDRFGDTLKAITAGTVEAFQWYRNGTMIPGASNRNLVVNLPGAYRVEVMDNNECSSLSQPFDVIFTSVDEDVVAGRSVDFRVFPNPTNGVFTIEGADVPAGEVTIELYSVVGDRVLSLNDISTGGRFATSVSMGELASGMYNIVVTTGNNRWNLRVVRQ